MCARARVCVCVCVCARVCVPVCVCMCVRVRSVAELMMYVDVTGKPRLHFSQQDLDKLNARGLSDDSCIKVQDTYFKPTARRKTGDSVRARVRAQRLGAGERVRGGA